MGLEADLLLDRRRLKRRLAFWRVLAVLAVCAAIGVGVWRSGAVGGGAHVARLKVNGIIAEDHERDLAVAKLADDNSVKALELWIDSPGGSVAGGEGLHDAVLAVARRKPVVAVMGGTAASAAYMIAVAANRIFCHAGTLTGSIGVIMEAPEVGGLLDKLGIVNQTLVSGPLKGQPSLTQPLSPAGREMLQGLVMDLYDQFVGMVAVGRHMDAARVRALADGRPYTGRQAVQLGLADQFGGETEARAWLAKVKGVPANLPAREIKGKSLVEELLVGRFDGFAPRLLKALLLQRVAIDGPWALWQPP
jgi:protease-4